MRKDARRALVVVAVASAFVAVAAARPATASACTFAPFGLGFLCETQQPLDPPCPAKADGETTYQFVHFLPNWAGGITDALRLGDGTTPIGAGASPCPDSTAAVILVPDSTFPPPPGDQADEADLVITPGSGAIGGATPMIVFRSTFGGPAGCFGVDPLGFGQVTAGQSRTLPFTLRSCGVTGLTIGMLHLGSGSSGFLLHDDGCSGHTLAPGTGSCTGSLIFAPGTGGRFIGSLVVPVNGPTSALILPLTGTGLAAVGPPGGSPCPGAVPPLPRPCTDVRAEKMLLAWENLGYNRRADIAAVGERVSYQITVRGSAPDPTGDITLEDTLPAGFAVDEIFTEADCTRIGPTLRCTGLHDGQIVNVAGHFTRAGTIENVAAADGPLPDPDPSNNLVRVSTRVVDPRADGTARAAPNGTVSASGGAAPGTRQVQVGLLRLGSGRPDAQVARHRTCAWLTGRHGRLRRRPADATGHCTQGVWQKAHGTEHWRFRAAHVPRGRYLLLVRAVDRDGVAEALFTRSRRNAVRLRVR
jgi:uncharacterized repeat protein (TIGR01451 family)